MKKEIAEIDSRHLATLRKNVSDFVENSAKCYDRSGLLVLDVAPQVHEGARPHFPLSTIETLDINPASGATYIVDLCNDNSDIVPPDRFDLIVCTEVLEHTLNPFSAVAEMHRIAKPGGIILVSTPFNFRIHGPLPDCWRFTEHGLRSLFSVKSGFAILDLTPLDDPDRFLMPIHYTLQARRIR